VPTVADTLPERDCPVCGRREWHGGDPDKPLLFANNSDREPPFVGAVWFVCDHCGYLRFHTLRLYRDADG